MPGTLDRYREVSCHNNYDAFIIEYTIQLREFVAGYSSWSFASRDCLL